MENLNGVGAGSGASGTRAPQPSTAEREEFFSGEPVWPAETAQSTKTELSSARANRDAAAEQGGGGGGESPLLAPAPDGSITIREAVKRVPTPWMPPARLVIELMFAGQALARTQVEQKWNGRCCLCCGAEAFFGAVLHHGMQCPVGRMERVLEEIESAQATPAPTVAATADSLAESFYEPWSMDVEHAGSVTDSRGIEVYDCAGATEVHEDRLHGYARRVRACVNFCAGVPTQKLEDAALLDSLQGEVARLKGGAR